MDDEKDLRYLKVLEGLMEMPYLGGKKLLVDFLSGDVKNKSIRNNKLDMLRAFGSLKLGNDELSLIIENLINNKLIDIVSADGNRFMKLLQITQKGRLEILNPKLNSKKLKNNYDYFEETLVSPGDRAIFSELESYLGKFNDFQKKAIVSDSSKILCVAGAGSGKTSVLTKRIEFLTKYKGVNPSRILAITFTRKAKQEMEGRLKKLGADVDIKTFNSFSENILRMHSSKIYNRDIRVMDYGFKAMAIINALNSNGLNMEDALGLYFSPSQRRNKTKDQLSRIFMNDCFSVIEFFKIKRQELSDFSDLLEPSKKDVGKMIYNVCKSLSQQMKLQGLRDFTDQIIDTVDFFKRDGKYIPEYEHVLVDEYQDVNAMQIELLELLEPLNLFCVGDPRQSIFGWRGSDINYILNFKDKHEDAEVITLTKNYRSSNHIIDLVNLSIKEMKLPDLEAVYNYDKEIKLLQFENEEMEYNFILQRVLSSGVEAREIFILARTNKQLGDLSNLFKQRNIPHVLKDDGDLNRNGDKIVLSTIHAAKGLEAELVFVMGCNEYNFPCKASDHPVIEMIRINDYDKEEEEKRIFYVALSRAKKKLYLTYTGKKPTYFISEEMVEMIG